MTLQKGLRHSCQALVAGYSSTGLYVQGAYKGKLVYLRLLGKTESSAHGIGGYLYLGYEIYSLHLHKPTNSLSTQGSMGYTLTYIYKQRLITKAGAICLANGESLPVLRTSNSVMYQAKRQHHLMCLYCARTRSIVYSWSLPFL